MKPVVVCLTLVTVAGGLGGVARGDGKFFAPENVPANVPYQRAFLLFHEGCETLLLQSKYEIPPSAAVDSLGWVVPVPAIPEISSMDADAAWFCFRLANRRTQPQAIHISHVFLLPALVLFLGGVGLLLVCLVQYPFIYRLPDERTIWGKQIRWVVVAIIVGFLLLVVSLPHLAGGGMVEVVKAEQVGIYDVKVIRAENSNALTEWLKDSGFSFGQEDGQAFQGYVDRGWCFVTAKVRPDPATNKQQIVAEGLAAPLILIFKSDKPVYPLALTATGGKETEILIYTFSDAKLTCGGRLKLRDARQCSPLEVLGSVQTEAMGWSLSGDVAKSPPMLCKFKSRLTPEQMKQDLIFDFASDNKPYRERKIAW